MAEPSPAPRRRLTRAALPALAAALAAAAVALFLAGQGGQRSAGTAIPGCILEGAEVVGGPIDLVDQNGARVTQADFAGEPALVYFGYTRCPDVCPTTLNLLASALAEPSGYDIQPVLITLDPEQDRPEQMRAYVATEGFPEGLVGLTGTPAQAGAAKTAFQVYSTRSADGTQVDHSSMIYVLDRQWHTVAIMPTVKAANPGDPQGGVTSASVEDVAACIAQGLERRIG